MKKVNRIFQRELLIAMYFNFPPIAFCLFPFPSSFVQYARIFDFGNVGGASSCYLAMYGTSSGYIFDGEQCVCLIWLSKKKLSGWLECK